MVNILHVVAAYGNLSAGYWGDDGVGSEIEAYDPTGTRGLLLQ